MFFYNLFHVSISGQLTDEIEKNKTKNIIKSQGNSDKYLFVLDRDLCWI